MNRRNFFKALAGVVSLPFVPTVPTWNKNFFIGSKEPGGVLVCGNSKGVTVELAYAAKHKWVIFKP